VVWPVIAALRRGGQCLSHFVSFIIASMGKDYRSTYITVKVLAKSSGDDPNSLVREFLSQLGLGILSNNFPLGEYPQLCCHHLFYHDCRNSVLSSREVQKPIAVASDLSNGVN
jgi:hypothetical protein